MVKGCQDVKKEFKRFSVQILMIQTQENAFFSDHCELKIKISHTVRVPFSL